MADPIQEEINKEVAAHKILIYGKGTKQTPMCGFTKETMQFFDKYGYPYELVERPVSAGQARCACQNDQLADPPQGVHRRTIAGDTDILDPMAAKGEIEPLLKKAFGK